MALIFCRYSVTEWVPLPFSRYCVLSPGSCESQKKALFLKMCPVKVSCHFADIFSLYMFCALSRYYCPSTGALTLLQMSCDFQSLPERNPIEVSVAKAT